MTLAISVASIILAISALARSVHSDRRRLLFQLHCEFISPGSAKGRAMLHSAFRTHGEAWGQSMSEEERVQINAALAQLDALAFQAERGYVSLTDALMLWGAAAILCMERAKIYTDRRRVQDNSHLWLWLEKFADTANKHPQLVRSSTARRASIWARWV